MKKKIKPSLTANLTLQLLSRCTFDTGKMSTPIQRAVDAAFKVFSRYTGGAISNDSLAEIKMNFNRVTKSELRIDPVLLEDTLPTEKEAPVTYMKILENKVMTVAVFILRNGSRLPLHDHPKMYGLLKVVHGKVSINTYTPLDPNQYPIPVSVTDSLLDKYGRTFPVYPTKYEGSSTVSETDEQCCVLSPNTNNIHEICASSGTAAFVDLLAPPYNQNSLFDQRPCSYYRELCADQQDPSIRYLVRINPPNDYWCDQADYTGPNVTDT